MIRGWTCAQIYVAAQHAIFGDGEPASARLRYACSCAGKCEGPVLAGLGRGLEVIAALITAGQHGIGHYARAQCGQVAIATVAVREVVSVLGGTDRTN